MGNLFGVRRRPPSVVVTAQDKAILQMKQQRDKIRIYQKKIETELESNKELATQLFRAGFKDRALVLLRRRKAMQEIVNRTDKQLETLEQLVSDIEFTQAEVSVVQGLKTGTEALKQLTNLMNIDDIQQMMEDNAEAAQKQQEISDILAQSAERFDEDDLLKELEKLADKPSAEPATDSKPEEPIETKIGNLPDAPKDIKEEAIKATTGGLIGDEPAKVQETEQKEEDVKEAELVPA